MRHCVGFLPIGVANGSKWTLPARRLGRRLTFYRFAPEGNHRMEFQFRVSRAAGVSWTRTAT
jgi:hypothetical protein